MNREVQLNLPLTDSSIGLKVLNSWKSLKFAQHFSRPKKKTQKMEIKSCKMVKSLDFFFKATTSALVISEILFVLVKSYSISPVVCSAS